jgi:hypothetical protein
MGLQYSVQYKKGIHNGAADALSHKPFDAETLLATTVLRPLWLQQVADSYLQMILSREHYRSWRWMLLQFPITALLMVSCDTRATSGLVLILPSKI